MRVPPFRDGQRGTADGRREGPHVGTGWLVSEPLVMTNHHVAAARTREELASVSSRDLQLQGRNATAEFDFDVENVNGSEVRCIDLVAWVATLDYATTS